MSHLVGTLQEILLIQTHHALAGVREEETLLFRAQRNATGWRAKQMERTRLLKAQQMVEQRRELLRGDRERLTIPLLLILQMHHWVLDLKRGVQNKSGCQLMFRWWERDRTNLQERGSGQMFLTELLIPRLTSRGKHQAPFLTDYKTQRRTLRGGAAESNEYPKP
jgi:hypothetical protein